MILEDGLSKSEGGNAERRAGFGRQARLTRARDFRRVFRNPEVSADPLFKVLACRGTAGQARLGLAVSRQVARSAAARNRLKRVIRESFRRHFAGGGPAIDFVVLPRSASVTICNGRLFASLEAHWLRILGKVGSEGNPSRS
jgi:ribonuclease P protein component